MKVAKKDPDAAAKRARRRMSNRIRADNSRKSKKEYLNYLEQHVQDLMQTIDKLRARNKELEEQSKLFLIQT